MHLRPSLAVALAVYALASPAQAQQTSITVDASKPLRPISPLLFGLNHRFGFDGYDSYQPARRRMAPRLVREVRRAGISWIRYPAGTMANLFRWQRAIGPPGRRGCQVNGAARGDGGPLSSAYGPDEHMRFVEQVGGTASIVVNFATGTPREAANWVRYMNGRVGTSRWANLRARHGHPRPYGVKWWEVANEPWLPWQDYWMAGEGVGATSASKAERYAFGGTTRFVRQPVGTECDRRPAAALSDGRPSQEKYADHPPVSAATVEVGGRAWRRVGSLGRAGARARVYELDRASGRIRFGDGRHGAIPPRGEPIAISYRSGPHAGFADFHRAMKAADPSIEVCSSFESADFVRAMGRRHRYDCLVAHPYLFYSTLEPTAAHDFAMAGADDRAEAVGELQRLARSVSGRRVPAAVTEYGVLPTGAATGGAPDADSDFLRSLDHALYTASQLIHFAELGVPLAGRHTLVDFRRVNPLAGVPSPTGFSVFGFAPSFTPSASARVLELMRHATGRRQVSAELEGNAVRAGYPALLALASRGRGGRVSLIVVNRDPERAIGARVAMRPLPRHGRLQAWTLNGPSTTAFNTPRSPNAVRLVKTSRPRPAGAFNWTFPAHSVTALTVGVSARSQARAAAPVEQPPQPRSGPGGSDYAHAGWRVSSGGSGADAWYVFEPVRPKPARAPLAVVMHGYGEYDGFATMYELIRHTVRKGSVVIYPRWQTAVATPCPGPFDIEPCMQSAVRGIRGALAFLRARPRRVQPQLSRTSYLGFSFGGVITANLANRYRSLHLPKPRAVWLEDPHDGGLNGFDEPAVDDSLAGIPRTAKLQCHSSAAGVISEPDRALGSCNAIFPKLGHVPKRNKDLVVTHSDAHGEPDLVAIHGVCAARKRAADAYDWNFCWKAWDGLRDCAYFGRNCRYALGNTPQHRSNGRWSDGVPITPLTIRDEPLLPPPPA